MSKSYRKAIIKERPRNGKNRDILRRRVRHAERSVDLLDEQYEIPHKYSIVDPWDYSDYRFVDEFKHPHHEDIDKWRRK